MLAALGTILSSPGIKFEPAFDKNRTTFAQIFVNILSLAIECTAVWLGKYDNCGSRVRLPISITLFRLAIINSFSFYLPKRALVRYIYYPFRQIVRWG
jgi:hypothetical protein